MSYINRERLNHTMRRPSKTRVTPGQAKIIDLNALVDEHNDRVALIMTHKDHWEKQAWEMYEDNVKLTQQIAALESRVAELEAENARLLRKATKRQGKHKGQEWEVDE